MKLCLHSTLVRPSFCIMSSIDNEFMFCAALKAARLAILRPFTESLPPTASRLQYTENMQQQARTFDDTAHACGAKESGPYTR